MNIHIVNYGTTINSKVGSGFGLVTNPPGPHFRDAPSPSTIPQSEGSSGAGTTSTAGGEYRFKDDPELALALRVSREEQRARQKTEGGGEQEGAGITSAGGNE